MIPVTKPFLPPTQDYIQKIESIWERGWLTNNGPYVNELESKVRNYLQVSNLSYVSNGTLALQIAIKALNLNGEIITTPFSYVATTSSIKWENCTPIFVDIDEKTFNIDANRIEKAINSKTTAILATHVFGNPCDIDAIEIIAKKHKLKVIYDAAHCFGTQYKNQSVFNYGDISTLSLHATKLFHSVEGGMIFCKDSEIYKKVSYMRNFGHDGPECFQGIGINGKNSELHAAFGLTNLKYIDEILKKRKNDCSIYDQMLFSKDLELKKQQLEKSSNYNFAYYPVLFPEESVLKKVKIELEKNLIYPRRYFYPSLTTLPYVDKIQFQDCSNANGISKRILCLPLFHSLSAGEVQLICKILVKAMTKC